MSGIDQPTLLTFAEQDKSPLSIRAKALVFIDPQSRALEQRAQALAGSALPVLIHGQSGTGKELLARHVHRESQRGGLFVPVSCAGLSPRWGEAELFGQARGAGSASRAGWFGSANGGTLYLDEIADLALPLQEKLLHCLQRGELERPGGAAQPVDVRLIAASSVDLARVVRAGRFDARLHEYLRDGELYVPPLQVRRGDILPLAEYFLGIYAQRLGSHAQSFSLAAQAALEGHAWPGNTRELENVVHFAVLLATGEQVEPDDLGLAG